MAATQQGLLYDLAKGAAIAFIIYKVNDYVHNHQAAQANNMRIKMSGVHMENDGTLNMDLQVLNPNSKAFTFRSIIGELVINANKIAELKMFGEYTVRSNDQATIPVTAKVSPALFKTVVDKLKGQKLALQFRGVINVNDKAIPITMQYSV